MGIWCKNDVVSTSMRRNHVASTFIRRHFTSCARWDYVDSRTLWPVDRTDENSKQEIEVIKRPDKLHVMNAGKMLSRTIPDQ